MCRIKIENIFVFFYIEIEMSSYLYKNMLIVERGTTNKVVIALIKITYNIWFEVQENDRGNERPWDKIILFYNPELYTTSNSDTFTEIDSNWMQPKIDPLGFMHLLSCDRILKVTKCRFPNHNDFSQEMRTFWQYIAESLRVDGVGNIDAHGVFIIYWDKDIVAPFANMVRAAGLMTNFLDCSHTFRDIEIRIAAASALSKSVIKSIYNTSNSIAQQVTPVPIETPSSIFGDVATLAPTTLAPAVGTMFGGTAPTAAPTAGTMFGTAPTAAPTSGTMFGAAAPSVGTMFGGTAPTAAPTAGTIFGAAAPSVGTMFGGTAPTAAPTSGTMFGAAAPSVGTMFGGTAPSVGTMFGGTAPTASPTAGTIFGAAAPSVGTMFGPALTNNLSKTTMFGTVGPGVSTVFGGTNSLSRTTNSFGIVPTTTVPFSSGFKAGTYANFL
jgi:hypothetical protein